MPTPMRAARRLILTGGLGLVGLSLLAAPGVFAAAPEKVLPDTTVFFAKAANAAQLRESFRQSQFGQLWADPAMTPFKDDLKAKLADGSKTLKEKVGVTIQELLELPQGPVSIAILPKDDAEMPAVLLISADAGKNADKMTDVLTKAMKLGEDSGAKVVKEEYKSLTLNIIQPPKRKDVEKAPPPLAWTQDGGVFTISTDLDALKDHIANASGRDKALDASENFTAAAKKLGGDGQVFWFADMNKFLSLVAKAGAKGKNADAFRQFETFSQVLGIQGLKAASGTFSLNVKGYDSVSKTFVVAPAPLQGLLKLFNLPKVSLKPETWVPATVASYQSWSWDLDAAFTAINDLANMFQPGVLNVLEQQLVGPNGGEPLNFKKDIFDPLGDRITVISDFKKPVTEDSQRMLVGVALEDEKAFQNTLTKIISLTGTAPKKREFQGATIYEFEVPEIPNNAGNNPFKGPISLTVAKRTLFISTEPTLLEMAIRGGGPTLADSPAYQAVAKEMPATLSAVTYVRPEESARATYEMIKSGQFEKALAQGAAAGGNGPDMTKIGKLFNKDKLPEFSVFAKYLAQGGGYTLMEDDGVMITSFTLRKATP